MQEQKVDLSRLLFDLRFQHNRLCYYHFEIAERPVLSAACVLKECVIDRLGIALRTGPMRKENFACIHGNNVSRVYENLRTSGSVPRPVLSGICTVLATLARLYLRIPGESGEEEQSTAVHVSTRRYAALLYPSKAMCRFIPWVYSSENAATGLSLILGASPRTLEPFSGALSTHFSAVVGSNAEDEFYPLNFVADGVLHELGYATSENRVPPAGLVILLNYNNDGLTQAQCEEIKSAMRSCHMGH